MMIRSLIFTMLFLCTSVSHSQIIPCTTPYEVDCPTPPGEPFDAKPCTQQECYSGIWTSSGQPECGYFAREVEYNSGGKYHDGIESIYGPGITGYFFWNHGTTWCSKSKACLQGTNCTVDNNGKYWCQSDPNAQWEVEGELLYEGVGDTCEITEEPI